jgi:hypothetical protein
VKLLKGVAILVMFTALMVVCMSLGWSPEL